MRIHVRLTGHYDWVPCPQGTQVTDDDVRALRVKQMHDGAWHMKIKVDRDTHHSCGLHEEEICRRAAALESLGHEPSRDEIVIDQLRLLFRHHMAPEHIAGFEVHDDGPDEGAYRAALAERGVPSAHVDAAVGRYLEPCDIAERLNQAFKVKKGGNK